MKINSQENNRPRPNLHVDAIGRAHPLAWKQIDTFRAGRGVDLPMWPEWCFAPLAAWYAIASQQGSIGLHNVNEVAQLAALGAWRVTQGIYRFDPSLYEAIIATPISGDLPCDVLYMLPEWCVYVESPNLQYLESDLFGFFAHLEWGANTSRHELRLVLDTSNGLRILPLHLGDGSLLDAIYKMMDESEKHSSFVRDVSLRSISPQISESVAPIMSLLLYLCSVNAEIGDGKRLPKNPEPKKTKNGTRTFAVDKPTRWDVGVRIGAALRNSYHQRETQSDIAQNSRRPHVRRAHWHGYWSGPKNTPGERKLSLKWLPPILINITEENPTIPTIRILTK